MGKLINSSVKASNMATILDIGDIHDHENHDHVKRIDEYLYDEHKIIFNGSECCQVYMGKHIQDCK